MRSKEAIQRAKKTYRDKGWRFTIDLYPSEQDLIDHIKSQPKKATYIKDLILEDMKRTKKGDNENV